MVKINKQENPYLTGLFQQDRLPVKRCDRRSLAEAGGGLLLFENQVYDLVEACTFGLPLKGRVGQQVVAVAENLYLDFITSSCRAKTFSKTSFPSEFVENEGCFPICRLRLQEGKAPPQLYQLEKKTYCLVRQLSSFWQGRKNPKLIRKEGQDFYNRAILLFLGRRLFEGEVIPFWETREGQSSEQEKESFWQQLKQWVPRKPRNAHEWGLLAMAVLGGISAASSLAPLISDLGKFLSSDQAEVEFGEKYLPRLFSKLPFDATIDKVEARSGLKYLSHPSSKLPFVPIETSAPRQVLEDQIRQSCVSSDDGFKCVVEPGWTLWAIVRATTKSSLEAIKGANGFLGDTIFPGQELEIPTSPKAIQEAETQYAQMMAKAEQVRAEAEATRLAQIAEERERTPTPTPVITGPEDDKPPEAQLTPPPATPTLVADVELHPTSISGRLLNSEENASFWLPSLTGFLANPRQGISGSLPVSVDSAQAKVITVERFYDYDPFSVVALSGLPANTLIDLPQALFQAQESGLFAVDYKPAYHSPQFQAVLFTSPANREIRYAVVYEAESTTGLGRFIITGRTFGQLGIDIGMPIPNNTQVLLIAFREDLSGTTREKEFYNVY